MKKIIKAWANVYSDTGNIIPKIDGSYHIYWNKKKAKKGELRVIPCEIKLLNNCVEPKTGLHIFNECMNG